MPAGCRGRRGFGVPTLTADEPHPDPTARGRLLYLFTAKHHGLDPAAARWLPGADLTREDEFRVFDLADRHEIANDGGDLYGLLRTPAGEARTLGTWGQQLAEFPSARPGERWHGYPLYPLNEQAPANRAGAKCRPAKPVLARMETEGLIDARERKRLAKGDHI